MIFRIQDKSWCDVVGDMFDYYEADSSGQLFITYKNIGLSIFSSCILIFIMLYEIRQQLYNSLTLLMIFTYAEMLQL